MKKVTAMILLAGLWVLFTNAVCYGATEVEGSSVTNVKASSYSCSKIRVSWELLEDADGYTVYRSSSKNGKYKQTYTTDVPEKNWYINTNRKTGKRWWYKVRGYQIVNGEKVFSKYSKPVSAYARPHQVQLTSIDSTGFIYRYLDLKWQKVKGASGYQVYMKERNTEEFSFMGNFKEPAASIEIPDTTKEYDLKVRAHRLVDGKKVYGKFSAVTSYEFDWTEDDLIKAGTDYILSQWPESTFDDRISSGGDKTPYNGTSWLAVWPKRFCLYEPWEDVETELYAAIDADVKMQGHPPQDVCFYIVPKNDANWVTVYLLS